ncbi:MAG: VOC family protein [Anaerolineae bacterium]|nr:VOC family protein [Anaerolineae bacterium]
MSTNPLLNAQRFRIARQTNQLAALRRFYCDGLGLPILSEFQGHAGYDGLILGLPDSRHQLEFVQHEEGSPGESPHEENLLVFYLDSQEQVEECARTLTDMGYKQVKAENPWWENHQAITIEDPDRYRVVFIQAG